MESGSALEHVVGPTFWSIRVDHKISTPLYGYGSCDLAPIQIYRALKSSVHSFLDSEDLLVMDQASNDLRLDHHP